MEKVELISFPDADALARAAANAWVELLASQRGMAKPFCVALSGGRIASKFFPAFAEQAKSRPVSMDAVHFFWADERCVPPDDAESSFRVARELLLSPLKISEANIHRIRGEESPQNAATEAKTAICRIVPCDAAGQPILDLVLLGMGEDGHVASLFPGEWSTMIENKAVYRAIKNSPKPPPNRVTLGYGPIVAARNVWVLISGPGKEAALRKSLSVSGETPLARVLQSRPHTRVFSDVSLVGND